MSWTTENKAAAAAESWELVDTVDRDKLQLRVFGMRGISNADAMRYVWNCASRGSQLHRHALQVMAHSSVTIKARKK